MSMTEEKTLAPGEAPEREFHAMAGLFPLLRGAAFNELAADIKNNGLREPILCDAEGRILDGRNRYRACRKVGVEPRFVTWDGAGTPLDLALSLNLKRRHLDESQRALVAARLAKMMELEAIQRRGRRAGNTLQICNQFPHRRPSSVSAGILINVSPRLIGYGIRVLRDGCEELIAAVESGQVAVSTASSLAGLPGTEQARVVAGGAAEIAKKAGELRGRRPRQPGGQFGVIRPSSSGAAIRKLAGEDAVVLLCVGASRLAAAIQALEARGFRHAPR